MRRRLIALLLFAVSTSAVAADFAGEWSGTSVANTNGKKSFYFIFWEDGTTLNGSGGRDLSDQDVIQNGTIDGNKISFDLSPGANAAFHFELTVDGADLKGTFEYKSDHGSDAGTLSLKKVKT